MKTENVRQWLESSQRSVPYELDFYTPFKDMASKPDTLRNVARKAKRKQPGLSPQGAMSVITVPSETSSTTQKSSIETYRKRPRHKTRADLYEYKGRSRYARRDQSKGCTNQQKNKKQRKRAKRDTADAFVAKNVSSTRLTLHHPRGIFNQGKASAPIVPGVPDLAFSEKVFLRLKQESRRQQTADPGHHSLNRKRPSGKLDQQNSKTSDSFHFPTVSRKDSDSLGQDMLSRPLQNPSAVYETPCRARQQVSKPAHNVPPDVQRSGPVYLGFGDRGPSHIAVDAIHRASPRKTCLYRDQATRMHDIHSNELSTPASEPCSGISGLMADPRALHSPTSNFQFAKLQRERLKLSSRNDPVRVPSPPATNRIAVDKHDEIVQILREIQETQNKPHKVDTIEERTDVGKRSQKPQVQTAVETEDDSGGCAKSLAKRLEEIQELVEGSQARKALHDLLASLKEPDTAAPKEVVQAVEHDEEPPGCDSNLINSIAAAAGGDSAQTAEGVEASGIQKTQNPIINDEVSQVNEQIRGDCGTLHLDSVATQLDSCIPLRDEEGPETGLRGQPHSREHMPAIKDLRNMSSTSGVPRFRDRSTSNRFVPRPSSRILLTPYSPGIYENQAGHQTGQAYPQYHGLPGSMIGTSWAGTISRPFTPYSPNLTQSRPRLSRTPWPRTSSTQSLPFLRPQATENVPIVQPQRFVTGAATNFTEDIDFEHCGLLSRLEGATSLLSEPAVDSDINTFPTSELNFSESPADWESDPPLIPWGNPQQSEAGFWNRLHSGIQDERVELSHFWKPNIRY